MKNNLSKYIQWSLVWLLLASAGISQTAQAEGWRGRGEIHHFHERDIHFWRGGNWYHGPYGGRVGWWWIVGGVYYYYPAPLYPYPDPYIPGPMVVAPPVVAAPPAVPAPAPSPAQTVQAQNLPSVWYYCEASKTYYPYVSECPAGWKTVPATPQK
jgi:hypothetical protein